VKTKDLTGQPIVKARKRILHLLQERRYKKQKYKVIKSQ